jgi:hypothetical protein
MKADKITKTVLEQEVMIKNLTELLRKERLISSQLALAVKISMAAEQQRGFPGLREAVMKWEASV